MNRKFGEFVRENKRAVNSWMFIIVGLTLFFLSPFLSYVFRYTFFSDLFFKYLPQIALVLMAIGLAPIAMNLILPSSQIGKSKENDDVRQEIQQALERARAEPEKVKPAWDLARLQLQQYFDRNLNRLDIFSY